jgi:hypothetical protein
MGVGKFWVGDSVGEGTEEEEGDEMEDTWFFEWKKLYL